MADESRFDVASIARDYAEARPNYPAELIDALDALLGGRLEGAHVVDIAAGTGIASRQLAERGAQVTAVELSEAMLAELAVGSVGIRAVRASAHALPLADRSVDMITCAQAWHWLDPERAIAEARRVLRSGGVLAIWWNHTVYDAEWEVAQAARFDVAAPTWRRYAVTEDPVDRYRTPGLVWQTSTFGWQRTISIDRHLRNVASRSYIAALGDASPDFLRRERRILTELFPQGRVTERFTTILLVTIQPA
jgi:SAM-dependent methyltransferase